MLLIQQYCQLTGTDPQAALVAAFRVAATVEPEVTDAETVTATFRRVGAVSERSVDIKPTAKAEHDREMERLKVEQKRWMERLFAGSAVALILVALPLLAWNPSPALSDVLKSVALICVGAIGGFLGGKKSE